MDANRTQDRIVFARTATVARRVIVLSAFLVGVACSLLLYRSADLSFPSWIDWSLAAGAVGLAIAGSVAYAHALGLENACALAFMARGSDGFRLLCQLGFRILFAGAAVPAVAYGSLSVGGAWKAQTKYAIPSSSIDPSLLAAMAPYLAFLVLLVVYLFYVAYFYLNNTRGFRVRLLHAAGMCTRCAYPVAGGASSSCPECGAPLD